MSRTLLVLSEASANRIDSIIERFNNDENDGFSDADEFFTEMEELMVVEKWGGHENL